MRVGLWLSCVYLFAVYFRPQELYPELQQIPGLMDWLAALAVVGTLLDVLIGGRPSLRQPQVYLLAFFMMWVGFSVAITSLWLGGAWEAFHDLSINAFVFFVVILHGSERSRLEALRRTLIAALLVTVVLGFRAYYLGPRQAEFVMFERLPEGRQGERGAVASLVSRVTEKLTGRGQVTAAPAPEDADAVPEGDEVAAARPTVPRLRALGLLNDPNDLAQTLIAAIPLVFLAWRPGRWLRNFVFALVPTAAMLWAAVLTRSRGGFVALFALAWFAFALRAGPRWERGLRWLGAAGLFLLMVLFFRLGAADESAMGRLDAWSEGLQMLKSSPAWGVGYGSFADINGLVAHNSFVHCFGELGLVGYFAWLGAIVASFWYLERARNTEVVSERPTELARWAAAAELSLVAFLAGALFLSRTYSVSLFLLIGLATAVAGVAARTTDTPDAYRLQTWRLLLRTGGLILLSIVLVYAVVVLAR
jgi:O-antigen ligase